MAGLIDRMKDFVGRVRPEQPRMEPKLLGSASEMAARQSKPLSFEADHSDQKPDELGPYTRHRTGDEDRPVRSGLRLSVVVNVVQVFSILALANTIDALLPLKEYVPYFLEKRSLDDAVVETKPALLKGSIKDVVSETEAARYVRVRHEVVPNIREMDRRWGTKCADSGEIERFEETDLLCSYMARHSMPDVYMDFVKADMKPIEAFIKLGKGRKIKILTDPIRKDRASWGDVWEIRFSMIDFKPREQTDGHKFAGEPDVLMERKFVATLWVAFDADNQRPRKERALNPFGFRVTKYVLADMYE